MHSLKFHIFANIIKIHHCAKNVDVHMTALTYFIAYMQTKSDLKCSESAK